MSSKKIGWCALVLTLSPASAAQAREGESPAPLPGETSSAREAPLPKEPKENQPPLGGAGTVVVDVLGGSTALQTGLGISFLVGPFSMTASSMTTSAPGLNGTTGTVTTKTTTMALAPSLDVFATDHLSLGGIVQAGVIDSSGDSLALDGKGHTLGVSPRVGWAFPIGSDWAFWPRASGTFTTSRFEIQDVKRDVWRTFGGGVYLGFTYRVARHLVVDVGPTLGYSVVTNDSSVEGQGQALGGLGSPSTSSASEQSGFRAGGQLRLALMF